LPKRSDSTTPPKRSPVARDPATTSRIMAAVRGRDTRPELALRKALHGRGLRFRVHSNQVAGRPDIVNRSKRVAIFVDGDFWHGNPEGWTRRGFDSMEAQFRSANRDRWITKLRRNIERDRQVTAQLESEGWTVIRVWESEIRGDLDSIADQIVSLWKSCGAP
jgi:DNA mismatch endonuclease (patch repair protein)